MLQALWLSADVDCVELDHEIGSGIIDGKLNVAHSVDGDSEFLTQFSTSSV
jgi:hypothetical protein